MYLLDYELEEAMMLPYVLVISFIEHQADPPTNYLSIHGLQSFLEDIIACSEDAKAFPQVRKGLYAPFLVQGLPFLLHQALGLSMHHLDIKDPSGQRAWSFLLHSCVEPMCLTVFLGCNQVLCGLF